MGIKKILRIIIICNVVLLGSVGFFLTQLIVASDQERTASERQLEYYKLGVTVGQASDYLTSQAREYVQYGNVTFYNNYMKEVNETKRRENAIARLKEMNTASEILAYLDSAADASSALAKVEEEAFAFVAAGNLEAARELMFNAAYTTAKDTISGYISQFQDAINQHALEEKDAAADNAKFSQILLAVFSAFQFLTIGVSFVYIYKKISTLNKIKEEMESNDGDLTSRIAHSSNDEIGDISRSFNGFTEKVQEIVRLVSSSSDSILELAAKLDNNAAASSGAAEDISRVIEEIANSATDQAKDTESGVSNMGELGDIIGDQVVKINALQEKSQLVNGLITEGFESINILDKKSEENLEISNRVGELMQKTSESTEKIEAASQMIKSIGEQTNLLALNAAIEAARAGESGKGFSVVAEEIRKLAEDSNRFAGEISEVIKELIDKVKDAMESIKNTESIANEQREQTVSTRAKFTGISESIEEMKELIQELSKKSTLVEKKKENILGVMGNLSAISEENAASTEEASAAFAEQLEAINEIARISSDLSMQTQNVVDTVNRFKF